MSENLLLTTNENLLFNPPSIFFKHRQDWLQVTKQFFGFGLRVINRFILRSVSIIHEDIFPKRTRTTFTYKMQDVWVWW